MWLKNNFQTLVGLSDHTTTNIAALTAIGMGSVAIEKHFKLDDSDCGPDESFSLNIDQLKHLVDECKQAWVAKGSLTFSRANSEKQNMVFRRSLYFVNSLNEGEVISSTDIRSIRPGYGLSPENYELVVGKSVKRAVRAGEAVRWDVLKEI